MSWGIWAVDSHGTGGWVRDITGATAKRLVFPTRAEAAREARVLTWRPNFTYEPRQILEKPAAVKRKPKKRRKR